MIENIIRDKAAQIGEIERKRLDRSFKFDSYVITYAARFAGGGFAVGAGLAGAALIILTLFYPMNLAPLPAVLLTIALALSAGVVGYGLALMWALYDQVKAYDQFNWQAYTDRVSIDPPADPVSRPVIFTQNGQTTALEVGHPGKDITQNGRTVYTLPGNLVLDMIEAITAGDLKVTRDKFRRRDGKGYFSGPAWEQLATGANGKGAMWALGYWDDENEWTPAGVEWVTR